MSRETLSYAIRLAGGQALLAAGIRANLPGSKVAQAHISGWLNQVKIEVPPPDVVIPICVHLQWQITPHLLRPDLYPNPTDALPSEIAGRLPADQSPSPQFPTPDADRRNPDARAAADTVNDVKRGEFPSTYDQPIEKAAA